MTLISFSAIILVLAALCAMSVAFARRVEPSMRLPMQWSFDGQPTWYAPRAVALAVTPILAALIIIPLALGLAWTGVGDTRGLIGILGLVGGGFLAAHAVHLGLLTRWLRSR